MKKLLLVILALSPMLTIAQTKLGTNPSIIDSTSVLQLESTSKGFLPTRITTVQRNAIAGPAHGLFIYNTDSKTMEYNFGTPAIPKWVRLISDSVGNTADWHTTGNNGLSAANNFIGTNDSVGFRVKVNHKDAIRVTPRFGGHVIVADSSVASYVEANLGTTQMPDAGYTKMTIARDSGLCDLSIMTSNANVGGYPILNLAKCGGNNINAPVSVSAGQYIGGVEMYAHNGGGYILSNALRGITDSVSGGNVFTSMYLLTQGGGAFIVHPYGGLTMNGYPSSRSDASTPVNFLYTDAAGNLQSRPISAVTGSFWSTAGNTLTGSEKFGATNDVDVVFIRNNLEKMRINNSGLAIGTAASSANAKLAVKDGHLQSQQTTAPTAAVSAAAGTAASVALGNATDMAGIVTLTTGTAARAAGGQLTVTFNKTYAVAPIVTITPNNGAAAAANVAQQVFVTSTTTGFTINYNVAATSSTVQSYFYNVVETQ